ncbi:hypothetical protein EXU57_08225 [Segetibacter sp. 3557_3]|uniref:AAA family ATPase n=1 Tax=Segetibacter sp. 3557_3 TaxID=2547429 RepID=UPI001058991A|nr:AAA family ATPase [Segetibacter sp. 3557_3]TDH26788.1 hypothetical protein EXU57_08225 [Segetibacter sp. 3557_3]
MNRIFIGKISKTYPQQFEQNFYAGGKRNNSWYGGIEVGDYVFPVYNSSIQKLWRVRYFSEEPNSIDPEGSVQFELIKEFKDPIPLTSIFARYKYFVLDLITVNKIAKSTASERTGFYEIHCDENCPAPQQIDFADTRNIYIALGDTYGDLTYRELDVRVLIRDRENLKIQEIEIFKGAAFVPYESLLNLYKQKNKTDEFYSLKELLEFAIFDGASKKEKFLTAVIEEIEKNGFFSVKSPIGLYDNVLVGRKRTFRPKPGVPDGPGDPDDDGGDDNGSGTFDDPELTKDELDEYSDLVALLKFSPNLILYGPPGTGKTHSAQKTIEAFEFDRTKVIRSFRQIQANGRATFVTFHQSFSYEEFVEGLRPMIDSENDKAENGEGSNLKYKVQSGILLDVANQAARSQLKTELKVREFEKMKDDNRIWKISLGERGKDESVYQSCIQTNTIAIGWLDDRSIAGWDYESIYNELISTRKKENQNSTNNANSVNNFLNEMSEGDLVLVLANQTSIRAIGMVDGPYEWKNNLIGKSAHRRKVKWLKVFGTPVNIVKYNGGKKLSQVTLYELANMKFLDIKELLGAENPVASPDKNSAEPYFLIIDEINRGNISKIFGELITLVEKDKRDKIKVRLPYSQKEFTLPANLYLIGTMNTSDRSIAVLDTALRRRFIFKEIEPNPAIIKNESQLVAGDLDLSTLLDAINTKISVKLDRDHRIGQSYFLEVLTLTEFKIVWYYQIIPLLMEYFYNDAESIAGIITESFIDKSTGRVKMIESDNEFQAALLKIK